MQPGYRIEVAGRCFGREPTGTSAQARKRGVCCRRRWSRGIAQQPSCSSRWRLGIYDLRGQTLSRG